MRLEEKDAAVKRAEKAEAGEAQLLQRLEVDQAKQADRMNEVMQMCEQMVSPPPPPPPRPLPPSRFPIAGSGFFEIMQVGMPVSPIPQTPPCLGAMVENITVAIGGGRRCRGMLQGCRHANVQADRLVLHTRQFPPSSFSRKPVWQTTHACYLFKS